MSLDASIVLQDNTVTAQKVDWPTIRLGKATINSNATSTAVLATPSAVSGLSVSFTLTETRTVRAILTAEAVYNSAANYFRINICNGAVSVANGIRMARFTPTAANLEMPCSIVAETTLSAGSYTFNVGMGRDIGGTVTLVADSTRPAFLTVEIVS